MEKNTTSLFKKVENFINGVPENITMSFEEFRELEESIHVLGDGQLLDIHNELEMIHEDISVGEYGYAASKLFEIENISKGERTINNIRKRYKLNEKSEKREENPDQSEDERETRNK